MVMTKAGKAFEAWRDADQAARVAERTLQRAWDDFALGQGQPPTKELIHDVVTLRAMAHEKLTSAIAVVDDEVELRKHPVLRTPRDRPSSR
jgi:ferric-dicitrate binding protein FerR (iron transport regulator)